jgi:hypothetical protein
LTRFCETLADVSGYMSFGRYAKVGCGMSRVDTKRVGGGWSGADSQRGQNLGNCRAVLGAAFERYVREAWLDASERHQVWTEGITSEMRSLENMKQYGMEKSIG